MTQTNSPQPPAATADAADTGTRPRSPTVDLPTKRRRKHGRARKPRRDNRKSRFDADYTADDERNNPHFEAYYHHQAIVPAAEFDALLATLATPLPTSFRISTSGRFRERIQERLRGEMSDLFESVESAAVEDAKAIKPPRPLPWYPEDLAWTVSAPRQMLRRDNVLAPFHKFLVQMNDLGAINRQEAVSMIPPLMLDVRPGQCVIDLCAAPGSKTAQILETASSPGGDTGVPALARGGLVIANDADIRRCWMLSHQLKRFASPDLVVTHHDAQFFPKIMTFDRVLCDVPCTGDGTLRKAPDIWRRWTPDMGIGIHRLQRQILERGLDILKPGGRLVYSTCSMNPLENEAVVAHALRKYGDEIELADVSKMLPGLIRRPGLTTWKVKDNSSNVGKEQDMKGPDEEENGDVGKEAGAEREGTSKNEESAFTASNGEDDGGRVKSDGGWFTSFDEVPQRRRKKIVRSLFPPSAEELGSGKFPLSRCMRLVPHDQDTGAFFVSVLVKRTDVKVHRKLRKAQNELDSVSGAGVGDENGANGMNVQADDGPKENDMLESKEGKENDGIEAEEQGLEHGEGPEEESEKAGEEVAKEGGRSTKGRRGTRLITDDPLVSVGQLNKEMLDNITSFFGIKADVGQKSLMTRGSDSATFKRVVAVSPRVRELLRYSLGSRDASKAKMQTVRVVNAGVRVLERTDRRDTTCPFRLIYEGLELAGEVMGARVGRTRDVEAMRRLVRDETVKLEAVGCKELRKELEGMGSGSCVVELVGGDGVVMERVVAWKGRSNVAVVMPREQVAAVRQRLGVGAAGLESMEAGARGADEDGAAAELG